MTERFKRASDIDERLERLRQARKQEEEWMGAHLDALKDGHRRGTLIKDAIYDALRATGPGRLISRFLKGWNR
jgi:hypothetical protein